MPDSSGAVDLNSLSPQEQAAVEDMAGDTKSSPPTTVPVRDAFIIFVQRDGDVGVATIDQAPHFLVDNPEPAEDTVFGAASTVLKDIQVASTAQKTVEFQMMQMQAMQQRAQADQIAAQVRANPKGRG